MKDKICYVVGAGENYGLDFQPTTEDFVIAADAGLRCLEKQGIKAGYTNFQIYCGTGGRIDHTMANLQVLAYLSANNMRGFLFDNGTVITAITNDRLCFEKIPCGYVSVFFGSTKAEGVTLRGLKYELNNAALTNTFPIGVSNKFMGGESSISVSDGTLFIVFPKEAKERIIQ